MDREIDPYINGLLLNNSDMVNKIYRKFFGLIESYVVKNSGTPEEAEDVFQEALCIIVQKIKGESPSFLECSFYTFLFSICRNIWLNELRRKKKLLIISQTGSNDQIAEDTSQKLRLAQKDIFWESIEKLSDNYCLLIRLFIAKKPLSSICKKLKIRDTKEVSRELYRARTMLKEIVTSNENYKNILADIDQFDIIYDEKVSKEDG